MSLLTVSDRGDGVLGVDIAKLSPGARSAKTEAGHSF